MDRITLLCDKIPLGTRVIRMSGVEGLSQLYSFTLDVAMPELTGLVFDMAEALGARATLSINNLDVAEQGLYHGSLIAVDWLHEFADHVVYRLKIAPLLWNLGLGHHSAVYVDQTIRQIIKEVLEVRNGFVEGQHYEFRLGPTKYEPLPHVSQYRESDLAFLQRRMEREGIYYFFEHDEKGEKLIITDTVDAHKESGIANYFPPTRRHIPGVEALTSFTCRRQVRPESVRLREFDYIRPDIDLTRGESVLQEGIGEVVIHGENYTTMAEGRRLVQVHAEELKAREVLFEGAGQVFNLRAGYTFIMTGHPRFDGEYLVTALHHNSVLDNEDDEKLVLADASEAHYEVRLEAIPVGTQYRPARVTPIPRIYGTEMGIVDGQQTSDFAQIDDHGRYKVRLFFNEIERPASQGSTWMRMLQPHAGKTEGFHFPLRKGTEVMLLFLGGDPDRPVIVGAIPNTNTPSPVTGHNATQNVIVTGGDNLIEMEDTKGSQHVHISTPTEKTLLHMGAADRSGHNVHLSSTGSALVDLGKELDIEVGGHKQEHVKGAVMETYDQTQDTVVRKSRCLQVYEADNTHVKEQRVMTDLSRFVHVGTDQIHHVVGNDSLVVDGSQAILVGGQKQETVMGSLNQTSGSFTQKINGDACITSTGKYEVSYANDWIEMSGPMKMNIGGGAQFDIFGGLNLSLVAGAKIEIGQQPKFESNTLNISKRLVGIDVTDLHVDFAAVRIQNNPLTIELTESKVETSSVAIHVCAVIIIS